MTAVWHWDQGRIAYFDFDAVRAVAQYVQHHDFKSSSRAKLQAATGFPFAVPATHTPWRNYGRVLKTCLLVSEQNGSAAPTAAAAVLAHTGAVTGDEYFHYLAEASTEPSPALSGWSPNASFRYPLLVVLKYLLTKVAVGQSTSATIRELIGMYRASGFVGHEAQAAYVLALSKENTFAAEAAKVPEALLRQARESIKVLCQISYLNLKNGTVSISLNALDAANVFQDLNPIAGPRAPTGDAEIRRLAQFFAGGSTHDFFDYPNTVTNDVVASGFAEGGKVAKTHVTIERNATLRKAYFAAHPTTVCVVCTIDTHLSYPWTDRVMDLHHLLPLCSGTRVVGGSTTFSDLVPLCPSCHRAVHRYYGTWFKKRGQPDFDSRDEAVGVYGQMKQKFSGLIHA